MWVIRAAFYAVLLVGPNLARAEQPPLEAFAALPIKGEPRLSPDGRSIALIQAVNGRLNFVIHHVDGGPPTLIPASNMVPRWIEWKGNGRLVMGVGYYADDVRFGNGLWNFSDAFLQTRLIGIDADKKNVLDLLLSSQKNEFLPPNAIRIGYGSTINDNNQDHVVSFLPGDDDHILVIARFDVSRGYELRKVNVQTGASVSGKVMGHNLVSVMVDADGVPRLRIDHIEKMKSVIKVRASDSEDWRSLGDDVSAMGGNFVPLAFSKQDKNILYVRYYDGKTAPGLYEFDLSTANVGKKLTGPVNAIVRHDQLVGYFWYEAGEERVAYLDPDWAKEAQAVAKVLPGKDLRIIDRTDDGRKVLFLVGHANQPKSYYLLDRSKEKPVLSFVFGDYLDIADDTVAPIKEIHYRARDGLSIPAFLTLPLGYQSGPIPFVVLPHAGPVLQDNPHGFDPLVQLIASRGYGVLQPQFRGSSGYGPAFIQAGFRQWGLSMQDDVTDGTKWLIDQHYADPAKICIVGRAYGGYSALMGLIKEPTLYKCGAALAPVSNLRALKTAMKHVAFNDLNIVSLGDDNDQLEATSPSENADRIAAPVLLVHGKKDVVFPVSQTEGMEAALVRAKKPAKVIYLDEADHALSRGEDRLAWQKAVEMFLKENLQ